MIHECSNCGKQNHTNKNCEEPITSVGIICIKLDKEIYNNFIQNLQSVSYFQPH